MATTVTNRLNGPVGTVPTPASMANSGDPVGITSASGSADYDATHPLFGLSSIRIRSRQTRQVTASFDFPLPANNWFVRFYAWIPSMPTIEVNRLVLFRVGDVDFCCLPTAAGNISMRAYAGNDLSAPEINPTLTGTPVSDQQWVRWELEYDGGSLVVRCYDGQSTTSPRIFTYGSLTLPSSVQILTGYRFRRRNLNYNANTFNQLVQDYQTKLNAIGYSVGTADGYYGPSTASAINSFQGDWNLPVTGDTTAGAETLAAIDVEHNENFFPERTWISHLEVNDSVMPGPAVPPFGPAFGEFEVSGDAAGVRRALGEATAGSVFDGQGMGVAARAGQGEGTALFSGLAAGQASVQGQAEGAMEFGGLAEGTKNALSVVEGTVLFSGEAQGEDTSGGVANGLVDFSGAASGLSRHTGQVEGDVFFGGFAQGSTAVAGEAEGVINFSGQLEYEVRRRGSGEGPVAFSGLAAGIAQASGGGSEAIVFDGSASGDVNRFGQANGLVEFYEGGEGWASKAGGSSGEVVFGGSAAGTKSTSGGGSGGMVFHGQADGTSDTILPDIVRTGLRYRLVAYNPNGSRRGELPVPLSWNAGVPLNDLSSLALEYPEDAPGAQWLDEPTEVALELAPITSSDYVEPPNCRFLALREQEDPTDRTGIVRYSMPGYGWQLRKVRNMNTAALDVEGKRSFAAATPGFILRTFLEEAKSRGNIPGLAYDFTNTHDSSGNPWNITLTLSFDAGQDLWSIVDALCNQGVFDWRFNQRTFQVYNADTTLHGDRTRQITLHKQRDLLAAPNDASLEALAARIFVMGDGTRVTVSSGSSLQPWGMWEDAMNQSGVSDSGTLTALAQARLSQTTGRRVQMTREVAFPTTLYLPLINYFPGDFITAPGQSAEHDDLRVRQITLTADKSQGVTGNLVLNDRFIERDLRRQRTLDSLTTSTGQPGGGGGSPGEDTRSPAAPTGLVLNSDTYIDNRGEAVGQISVGWLPVTTATDGSPMDVRSYEVWARHAVATGVWQLRTVVNDSPNPQAFLSPFDVDEVYQVQVRAVGRNERRGPYAPVQSILVDPDMVPPPPPSAPLLSTRLSVIQATWDGQTFEGLPMPIDFDHIRVWMSADPVEDFERVDTLYREGTSTIPGQPYEELRYVYFTAVDRSGNESGPSATASIAPEQLVPTDITPGSIGYELLEEGAVRDDILADDAVMNRHVAAGQITGDKVRAYSITADRIAVGNTKNLITDPSFLNDELFNLRDAIAEAAGGSWGKLVTAERNGVTLQFSSGDGTYRYYFVQNLEAEGTNDPAAGFLVDEDDGRVVFRAQGTTTGQPSGTSVQVAGFVRFLDRDGALIDQPSTTGTFTWTTGIPQEIISSNGAEIPNGAISALVYVRVILAGFTEGVVGSFQLTRPFAATSNGQVLIEDGAVSANKIQANAITADKIDAGAVTATAIAADAITTDKLAANAITAKHTITGALIQTTSTINRGLKIDSAGMRGYDANGNPTLTYWASSGNVTVAGRFQTGPSNSNNVIIDSGLWAGRPAIQLHTGNTSQVQPVMYSMGAGSSDYPAGALLIHGRENTANSSGRNTLRLGAGNGVQTELVQEYGSYGGMGIGWEGWNMYVRGRMFSGQDRLARQTYIQSSTFSGTIEVAQTLNYGQAAPNGSRMVHLTAVSNTDEFITCATCVTRPSLSGLRVVGNNVSTSTSYRINALVTWTSGGTG